MTAVPPPCILVTGATGFIGSHVVDELLRRGLRVRAATRSVRKGELFKASRPQYAIQLDIVKVGDFSEAASFEEAVKDIDGIIHVASPFSYSVQDNEQELVRPAIEGVKAILKEAAAHSNVTRVVITSSFAAVMDANRKAPPRFTYTAAHWNPLSYDESVAKKTSPVVAYRGSKKFAELEAWNFVKKLKPGFDLVTLCPPMTFGPICHPISRLSELNESNANLWKVASGEELPVARVPFWVDVRDLANAHVQALLKQEAAGKRYTVASPDKFSYGLVAEQVAKEFEWGQGRVAKGEEQIIDDTYDLDGETAARELGITYRPFKETIKDFIDQAKKMEESENR